VSSRVLAPTRSWIRAHANATASYEGEPAALVSLTALLLSQPVFLVDVLVWLSLLSEPDMSVGVDNHTLIEQPLESLSRLGGICASAGIRRAIILRS